jgi:hypothetical protein
MYNSTLSLTSALDGVGGQRHSPAALPPGKTRYSLYKEAGWALGSVWTGADNLVPIGIRFPDRPARSESLYLPHYPGPRCSSLEGLMIYARKFISVINIRRA